MYDTNIIGRAFTLGKDIYSGNPSDFIRARRLFDRCLENDWPVEVAVGCLLYKAYEINPLDYQGAVNEILELLPSAKSVLETLSRQNKSFRVWINGVKMSPYGRAVVWLRALDELASLEPDSTMWLDHLPDLYPNFTL